MNDFYITNPVSMDFLLDWIYIKGTCSSYITPFLKNIFVPACFPLVNTEKYIVVSTEENEFFALVLLGTIIHF